MHRLFRPAAAALVLALLLAGSAQAGPIARRAAPPGPVAFLDLFQDWLCSLRTALPDTAGLSPVWEQEGSIMDPNGRDGTAPPKPSQDEGGIMDPNGTGNRRSRHGRPWIPISGPLISISEPP